MVALAVFGAIIFFHYGSFDYDRGYKTIQFMTAAEKATAIKKGRKVIPKPFTPEEQGFVDLENLPDKGVPTERVVVEYPGQGLHLSGYPGIRDIRMPLFVLAVFYVGLFSILGNKKD